MIKNGAVLGVCLAIVLGVCGCSRQQSDWEKTRAANTTDSYEQFLKKYPSGEFSGQAQARVKELYEEHDWQKARDADTQEAYQAFVKQHPEGKWTEEARIRVENFTLAQAPSNPSATTAGEPASAPVPAAAGESAAAGETAATTEPAAGGSAGAGETTASGERAAAGATAARKRPAAAAQPRVPAADKVSKTARASGSYGVQLGAFKSSSAAANKHWSHLQKEYPKLLAGLSPTVSPKKGASGTLYRLQSWGVTEKQARAVCKAMKAKSQPCVPIHKQA